VTSSSLGANQTLGRGEKLDRVKWSSFAELWQVIDELGVVS